jgi:hypothetical protein
LCGLAVLPTRQPRRPAARRRAATSGHALFASYWAVDLEPDVTNAIRDFFDRLDRAPKGTFRPSASCSCRKADPKKCVMTEHIVTNITDTGLSRIEAVGKALKVPIIVSDDFARAYGKPLHPLGRHVLRGLATPHELYSRRLFPY